jgi:hypothetical protein
MFVETYRYGRDSIMTGGDIRTIPYPKLTNEDWRAWKLFLPFHAGTIEPGAVRRESLYFSYGIPYALTDEIKKATEHFDRVEIWRKTDVQKDPIAVGILGSDRYLIARWGMEKLAPFNVIKKSVPLLLAWKIVFSPAGAMAGLAALSYLVWGFLP